MRESKGTGAGWPIVNHGMEILCLKWTILLQMLRLEIFYDKLSIRIRQRRVY